MKKRSHLFKSIATVLFVCLLAGITIKAKALNDPRAREILDSWRQQYEASIAGVDNYTAVWDDQTFFYQKKFDNGRPYFTAQTHSGPEEGSPAYAGTFLPTDVYNKIKDRAVYEGRQEVDGHEVYVLYVDRVNDLFEAPNTDGSAKDIRIYLDTGIWTARKVEGSIDVITEDGVTREAHAVFASKDIQNIEGMYVPHETHTIITGTVLTDEERKEAEESLKQMEEELAKLSEQERMMVERMMGDRLTQARRMLEEDQMEFVRILKDIQVNTGNPF